MFERFLIMILIITEVLLSLKYTSAIIKHSTATKLAPISLDDESVIAKGTPFERLKIGNSIVDVIGGTPLIKLNRLAEGLNATILLKLESMEPCNSVKDRIGKSMIEEAEKKGLIQPGSFIVLYESVFSF
jgi:hypothetical protein